MRSCTIKRSQVKLYLETIERNIFLVSYIVWPTTSQNTMILNHAVSKSKLNFHTHITIFLFEYFCSTYWYTFMERKQNIFYSIDQTFYLELCPPFPINFKMLNIAISEFEDKPSLSCLIFLPCMTQNFREGCSRQASGGLLKLKGSLLYGSSDRGVTLAVFFMLKEILVILCLWFPVESVLCSFYR